MIPANPSDLARRIGAGYFHRHGKSRLAGIHAAGLEGLAPWDRRGRGVLPEHPLIVFANHASWWDALMPIHISLGHFDHDAYGVMAERQLRRFRFFTRLGMFSIDRENPRSAIRSLHYGADLLRGTGRVLWYFPQGKIVPNDVRPIEIQSGTTRLIQLIGRATVVPIAFRYELIYSERPDVWVRAGTPIEFDNGSDRRPDEVREIVRHSMTVTLDRLRDDVLTHDLEEYEAIFQGKGSIDNWWNRVRGKTATVNRA